MMEIKTVKGITLSKLSLGTVALGLDYGISNTQGKPSRQQSFEILNAALNAGIKTLDTARSYGNAEEMIGEYFSENYCTRQPTVCSKFKISREALRNKRLAYREMESSIEASLRHLKLAQLPVCLLHMDRTLPFQQVLSIVPGILAELKNDGLIAMGGVSIDHPLEVASFLEYPVMDVFQVPMNLFDQRLLKSGLLQRLEEEGKMVMVRSVFLQGLFFLDAVQLRGNLVSAVSYLDKLKVLAVKAGMTLPQMAFSFVRDLEGVSSLLFGAENVEQVKQNMSLLEGKSIPADIREEICSTFDDISENIITPAFWTR